MLVHISICSLIGGLSVSCLQGLGACIVTSIEGKNQFKQWFIVSSDALVDLATLWPTTPDLICYRSVLPHGLRRRHSPYRNQLPQVHYFKPPTVTMMVAEVFCVLQ